jgi:ABC-2 type transport system ATP-binding protein
MTGLSSPVTVAGVTKRYGGVRALDDVSLALEPGTVHALAGPNGSGKTTLLRVVAGLTRPTAGEVTVPEARVGYAFQRPNVYPDLTVAENLDVFARMADARPSWRESVVERLRLHAVVHRRAGDLSDGFAKKLDLALALLKEPDVLLLDEPLADVDDATELRLLSLLDDYRSPGRVVVLSSHNLGAVGDLLDRLTVLVDGRTVLDEPTAALDGTPREAYAALLEAHL